MGELPPDVTVEVFEHADRLPSEATDVRVWVPPFLGGSDATALLRELPDLAVVQLLSAGADAWAGRTPPGVTLCDARGVHDPSTAEWVVTAVLAQLRAFPTFIRAQAERRWANEGNLPTDELTGKRVLIVGAGAIGTAVRDRLAPFEVSFTLVARTARPEQGVHGVEELPRLLPDADVVIVIVPLTDQTRGLIDKDFLAAMPDGALLVNAARGRWPTPRRWSPSWQPVGSRPPWTSPIRSRCPPNRRSGRCRTCCSPRMWPGRCEVCCRVPTDWSVTRCAGSPPGSR